MYQCNIFQHMFRCCKCGCDCILCLNVCSQWNVFVAYFHIIFWLYIVENLRCSRLCHLAVCGCECILTIKVNGSIFPKLSIKNCQLTMVSMQNYSAYVSVQYFSAYVQSCKFGCDCILSLNVSWTKDVFVAYFYIIFCLGLEIRKCV